MKRLPFFSLFMVGALSVGCTRDASSPEAAVIAAPETFAETVARVKAHLPASSYVTNAFISPAGAPRPTFTQRAKLRIGMPWILNDECAPWYVAIERKFFDAVGLDVALLSGGPGQNYLAVLAGGGVEISVINMNMPVTRFVASPTGADVVIVGVTLRDTPEAILTIDHDTPRDQRSKRVLKATDFAGKTIAVETTSQYIMEAALRLGGQDPAAVKFLRASTVDMLILGRADGMASWIVNQPRLLEDAGYKNWAAYPLAGHGFEGSADVSVVRRDFLQTNPELVRRYLWALRQALEYILNEPAAAAAISSRYSTGLPLTPSQVERRFELQRSLMIGDGVAGLLHADLEAMDRTTAYLVRGGVLTLPSKPR